MKAIHLLTEPESQRESRSIVEIRNVAALAKMEYVPIVNKVWTEAFPEPRECNDRPFQLTKAHYGCYMAHKMAIQEHLNEEGLWMFECDAVFAVPPEEAAQRVLRAAQVCVEHPEITMFTLGYRHNGQGISRPTDDTLTINQFIETHAYYVPWSSKPVLDAMFQKDWDALDYCYCIYLCDQTGAQIGIFADRPICVQGLGNSLIDGVFKGSEPHFRNVRYKASFGWKA